MALDAFNREFKGSIDDLKAALLKDIGKTEDSTTKQSDNTEQLKALNKNLENIIGGQFNQELKALRKLIGKVANCCDNISKKKDSDKKTSVKEKSNFSSIEKFLKAASKRINDMMATPTRRMMGGLPPPRPPKTVAAAAGAGGVSGGGGVGPSGLTGRPSRKATREYWKGIQAASFVKDVFSGAAMDAVGKGVASLIGGGISAIGAIFGPIGTAVTAFLGGFVENLLGSLVKPFTEAITQRGDELQTIWSQTGFGIKAAEEEQKKFAVTQEDARGFAMDTLDIRKQLVKTSKKGITDEKTLRGITKSGLNLAVQIGSNAEATADTFADWNLKLGLSNFQLSTISRGMRDIARQTGLTGDNLLNVARNSEQFLKNMKAAGTLSATAANNIMTIAALSEKTGTTQLGAKVTGALSTSFLSRQLDDTTRRLQLIMMQGMTGQQQQQFQGGTAIRDTDTIKLAAKNLEAFVRDSVRRRFGKELENLTEIEKGTFSEFTKEIFGVEAGFNDLMLTINNLKKAGMSYTERLDDLQQQIEKTSSVAKKTDLEKQKEGLFLSKSNVFLEEFMNSLQRTGKANEALGELRTNKDYAKLAEIAGTDLSKGTEAVTEILKKRVMMLNQRAGELKTTKAPEDIIKQANEALKANNTEGFKDIVGQIQDLEDEADRRAQDLANPVKGINDAVMEIKNMIREMIDKVVDKIIPLLSENLPLILQHIADISSIIKKWFGSEVVQTGANAIDTLRGKKPESTLPPEVIDKAIQNFTPPKGGFSPEELKDRQERLGKMKAGYEYDKQSQETLEKEFEDRVLHENFIKRGIREGLRAAGMDRELNALQQRRADVEAEANAIQEMEKSMNNPGSIFTHDTHLEKLLEDGINIQSISDPEIKTMLPNASRDAEEEMRRRNAEMQKGGDDLSDVEANTGSTAANTRATVRLLGQLGRMLAKKLNNNNLSDVNGPDYPTDAFFEDILNTEWPNARMGRKVGLEFDYTDLS